MSFVLCRAIEHNPGCEHKGVISIVPRSTSSTVHISACSMASTNCWTGCGRTRCGPRQTIRAPGDPPGKYETGTQNHEGIAGTLAAVNYLAEIGAQYGKEYQEHFPGFLGRRLHLKTGMTVLRKYDHVLSAAILDELQTLPGVQIHGITDRSRLEERVPTVSFTWEGRHPREIAAALGEQGIYVWDGNYYALAVTERLGLEGKGGMVRIGAVHYNTMEEIRRMGDALRAVA
jgi:selenocysteine lyase/cysteine desulfurase